MHFYKACKWIFHSNTFRLEFLKRGKFFATFATKIGKIRKNRRATRLKRAKKVHMHFYQRVIIHYTHTFFSGRLFSHPFAPFLIQPPPVLVHAVILRLKPSAAAAASDVLHLPHSTWPCPKSVSIPDLPYPLRDPKPVFPFDCPSHPVVTMCT